MSTTNANSVWRQVLSYLLIALAVVIVLLLFTINYYAGAVMLAGILLAWPARRLFVFALTGIRGWPWKRWLMALVLLLVVVFLVCGALFVLTFQSRLASLSCSDGPIVQKYSAVIEPVSSQANTFIVKESIANPCPITKNFTNPEGGSVINLPERQINGHARGLLLNEVVFSPLQSSGGNVSLKLPDGSSLSGPLCGGGCPESAIDLRDFPANSFYAAKGAENVTRSPYIDTEEITWSMAHPDQGVVFAYIPAPFQYVRPIIEPFIGVSSASQFIYGLVGLLGTVVVSPIVKPVLVSILQDRFKGWLDGKKKKGKKE